MSKETPNASDETIVEEAKNQATKKAAEIEKKLNKKVYPLVCFRPATKEVFIGYIQEPTRAAKMEAFDIMSAKESLTGAGEIILATSLIKEESHEAFYSLDSKFDDVYMSACIDSISHVQVLINALKKK